MNNYSNIMTFFANTSIALIMHFTHFETFVAQGQKNSAAPLLILSQHFRLSAESLCDHFPGHTGLQQYFLLKTCL